ADGDRAVVDADDDARGVAGPAPAFGRPVQMPRSGHLHVCMEHVTVGEVHEEVLARGVDRGDLGARFRSASTARIAAHLELDEAFADERRAQSRRGAKDRVTFGHVNHGATCVSDRPRVAASGGTPWTATSYDSGSG